jgi:predicted acyltransferase (DUF342 family)
VDGNVNAGTDITLHGNVIVSGDIDGGRTVFLSDGATVRGKVIGRYGVQFSTMKTLVGMNALDSSKSEREVSVGGNVESESFHSRSGKMLMKIGGVSTYLLAGETGIRIEGSIFQRGGSVKVEGNVHIGGGIDMHGIVSLRSCENRKVVIRGNTSMNGVITTEGDVTIE